MTQPLNNLTEEPTEEDIFDDLGEQDFVFILDQEGGLKTMLLPENFDQDFAPETVAKMLKVLGISRIEPRTIH